IKSIEDLFLTYDTYLLEKVDSNTSPGLTNMSHKGGEIDQDADHDQVKNPLLKAEGGEIDQDAELYQAKSPLLKAGFLKTNDMVEKEVYNELSNRFLQLEKHCISEIDQDAELYQAKSPLLKAGFLKTNDMVEKEVYNELSNRFLQLEKHCISLEILIQHKEESFQSNKPCKIQDAPEFLEYLGVCLYPRVVVECQMV
ncbi:hypothetical protein Tco_1286168, partial [Tanacetum coccineum]